MFLPKFNYKRFGYLLLFLFLVWPSRFAVFRYENIAGEDIYDNLIKKTSKNMSLFHDKGVQCDYSELLEENHFFYKENSVTTNGVISQAEIKIGGEYWPEECNPSFSTAVIVPYRNRPKHLKLFLDYIHNYLRKQNIHYKIFVVEQNEGQDFNRAKLFNIGAKYALKENFPCLVMQDVDLMPMNLGNIYACTHRPRHMSSSIDVFRFTLPYYGLFGGAVAISAETFVHINGFSNLFKGWGGEDDDLYLRLVNKDYKIIRFHPSYAQWTMLQHAKEPPSPDRNNLLKDGYLRFDTDGLNSLVYREINIDKRPLYTNVLVDL